MSIKPKKQKKIKKSPKIPAKVVNEDVEMSAEDEDEENEETPLRTATNDGDHQQEVSNDEHVDDGNGLAIESPAEDDEEDDDDMDLANFRPGEDQPKKKRKKGIIYISNIPKHMNVTRIREILGEYGKIGRVYLQPEKLPGSKYTKE